MLPGIHSLAVAMHLEIHRVYKNDQQQLPLTSKAFNYHEPLKQTQYILKRVHEIKAD